MDEAITLGDNWVELLKNWVPAQKDEQKAKDAAMTMVDNWVEARKNLVLEQNPDMNKAVDLKNFFTKYRVRTLYLKIIEHRCKQNPKEKLKEKAKDPRRRPKEICSPQTQETGRRFF